MAYGNSKRTLLGFADEYMSSDTGDCYTNKIGGLPDWCHTDPDQSNPTCDHCSSQLSLVCQISAPLSSSPTYQRSLYLFGCLQPPCWNRQDSWTCLRSQTSLQAQDQAQADLKTDQVKVTDWLGEADDWGEEE